MKIYHFHNGTGGGVLSVIRNLLLYKQHECIENHVIYTINKEQKKDFKAFGLAGAASEQVFYYSPKWNFYYTCKKLASLLANDSSVIVAHDWLELGMASNLGLQNPVIQVLHGDFDYYYELSEKNKAGIDEFICVSPVIASKLRNVLTHFKDHISYIKFPIQEIKLNKTQDSPFTAIYFVRDLTEQRKQFHKIPIIHEALLKKNIHIRWIIAGGGVTKEDFPVIWGNHLQHVTFYGSVPNNEILKLLSQASIMVLPSLMEGFPVAVAESMKCGVVPLITDWGKATAELVIEGETGFLFDKNDIDGYVSTIEKLVNHPMLLAGLSKRAIEVSNYLFDPYKNTFQYEEIFIRAMGKIKRKKSIKIYGSRLDHILIPNKFTCLARKFLAWLP